MVLTLWGCDMDKQTIQRLAGAFVEANACASMLLEMMDALRVPETAATSRLEAMASCMELMVQRMGYVNQVAAHLACPGLLDVPHWSNWMSEPMTCDVQEWFCGPNFHDENRAAGAGLERQA